MAAVADVSLEARVLELEEQVRSLLGTNRLSRSMVPTHDGGEVPIEDVAAAPELAADAVAAADAAQTKADTAVQNAADAIAAAEAAEQAAGAVTGAVADAQQAADTAAQQAADALAAAQAAVTTGNDAQVAADAAAAAAATAAQAAADAGTTAAQADAAAAAAAATAAQAIADAQDARDAATAAQAAAEDAQTTANGRVALIPSDLPPAWSGPADTAIWINTADGAGRRLSRWDGDSWEPQLFGTLALAPGSIVASDVLAEGTITGELISADALEGKTIKGGLIEGGVFITNQGFPRVQIDPNSGLQGLGAVPGNPNAFVVKTRVGVDGLLYAEGATITGLLRTRETGARVELEQTLTPGQVPGQSFGQGQLRFWYGDPANRHASLYASAYTDASITNPLLDFGLSSGVASDATGETPFVGMFQQAAPAGQRASAMSLRADEILIGQGENSTSIYLQAQEIVAEGTVRAPRVFSMEPPEVGVRSSMHFYNEGTYPNRTSVLDLYAKRFYFGGPGPINLGPGVRIFESGDVQSWTAIPPDAGWTSLFSRYQIRQGIFYFTIGATRASWAANQRILALAANWPTLQQSFMGINTSTGAAVPVLVRTDGVIYLPWAGANGVYVTGSYPIGG